ncbi:MAG: response regulator [Chloroflexota bacterium]|nr:response regulator [Chloroflexota bacterium]
MHIGLLEDDIAIQEMLKLVLQDENYAVTIYPTAEECLDALLAAERDQAHSPLDLLIVDWRLPGLVSGIQVIQKIRDTTRFRALPIILTTAASFSDTPEFAGLQATFLEKPFAIDEMVDTIKILTHSDSVSER